MTSKGAISARVLFGALVLAVACAVDRPSTTLPSWDDVAPIVQKRCASCHSGPEAAAGYRLDSYLDAVSCVANANVAAPILQALDMPPHVGILSDDDRATLTAWVTGGQQAFAPAVHTPDIIDPRAPGFHATVLRAARWTPMLDPNDPNACGRCHDGTLSRPLGVTSSAPGAPDCTSCHNQQGGILACGTCHGTSTHAFPPRDTCFFPNDPPGGAHAVHVLPSATHASGFACGTCHPTPGNPVIGPVIGGLHGDGAVEVMFDPTLVSPEMSWDPTSQTCAVSCHDRGGARPRPGWNETKPMGCNDCHSSPPANHYAGPCNNCHAEANATGTALSGGPLHMNGKVDLGNGNGTCGACHGTGSSPWPPDATHSAHAMPTLSLPVACSSCHVVPKDVFAPGHLDSPLAVRFSGHALDRGALPTWDGTSCQNVACHGANLADPPATPAWADTSGKQLACNACHGAPPTQHTTATDCSRSICHGSEVTPPPSLAITPAGLSLHINGVIDVQ